MNDTGKYTGPVFIIGNARSGTKLLRSLLNNHPDISLGGEGNYIPMLIKRFGVNADISQPPIWRDIFQEFSRTTPSTFMRGQVTRLYEQYPHAAAPF